MRIITQNGKSLELDNIELYLQDEVIAYQSQISRGQLGSYKTAEMAELVFMEIHAVNEDEHGFGTFEMPEYDSEAYINP